MTLACPEQLTTARLVLRRWRETDREPFARMNADPEVMRFFPSTRSRAESDAGAANFERSFADEGFGAWAVEVPGAAPFIGFVGPWRVAADLPIAAAVEIGWRLDKPYWGKGYATEAAVASLRDLYARTDCNEVLAYTTVTNRPSRRVMDRLGMRYDPARDFPHPRLPPGHPLEAHVVYAIARAEFARLWP